MSKARHRRPSRAASIASGTAAVGITAGTLVLAMNGTAHAQVKAPADTYIPAVTAASYKPVASMEAKAPVHRSAPAYYTVKNGDTLSGIAGSQCRDSADWTGIYERNKRVIGNDYNLIYAGQQYALDCRTAEVQMYQPPAPVVQAYQAPAPAPQADNDDGGSAPAPAYHSAPVNATYQGSGGMQQCIISRESGGNAGIWNASGHWGLYQFSESTWIAHGGSPGSFGNASVAEQNQVYYNTVAQDGYSDWAPYDGCL